jgi:succinate dehydrogenase / fumarate reductase, cytochrome b subunit
MSLQAPTKKLTPTNTLPSKSGLLDWFTPLATSTVGSKILVAVTGALLTGFVIAHLIGNLKMFEGPESINTYAVALKANPVLLWGARFALLTVFLIHLVIALGLVRKAYAARPVGYAYPNTVQASWTSRMMPLTGIMILLFVIFHIAHYTVGVVPTANTVDGKNYLELREQPVDPADPGGNPHQRHDVHKMVVAGFSVPWVSIVYIVAQFLLMLHLAHGIGSMFQSVGLNTQRTQTFFTWLSWTVAILIFIGNCAIVVAVWAGYVK